MGIFVFIFRIYLCSVLVIIGYLLFCFFEFYSINSIGVCGFIYEWKDYFSYVFFCYKLVIIG